MIRASVLVVDDEDNFREGMVEFLSGKGFESWGAANLSQARNILEKNAVDIVLLDVQLGGEYGPDLLDTLVLIRPCPRTIVMTAYGDVEVAVSCMRRGAFDFLSKPVNFDVLENTLKNAEEMVRLNKELEQLRSNASKRFAYVEGRSPAMQRVFSDAGRAARAGASVLITGETGCGKEIVAEYIHRNGPRASKPLVAINCPAIQPTVLESELFGHEAGAFTGAVGKKPGLFEVADGGVLFLDEVSSMGTDMQAKILRAIEDRKVRHVGGSKEIPVDVQIIAATNHDLQKMIEAGTFREDLFYRLNVVNIRIPPLRDRIEDIPELAGFFLRKVNEERGLNIQGISPDVIRAFEKYGWRGNLRQLRNEIERASIFCVGEQIELCDISKEIAELAL